jgi:hypothetical protein
MSTEQIMPAYDSCALSALDKKQLFCTLFLGLSSLHPYGTSLGGLKIVCFGLAKLIRRCRNNTIMPWLK